MYEAATAFRDHITGFCYRSTLKPAFFRRDPEAMHERMTALGRFLGRRGFLRRATAALFSYAHPALRQTINGIQFQNPVGLAAGFDKDAELVDILPAVGFGFMEVGSITGEPCEGNVRPRLWRLPKSKGLIVYYGLKSKGCERIAAQLFNRQFAIPIGTSVAKTNSPATVPLEAGVADYAKAFRALAHIGQYTTVNISCPNAFGGEPFVESSRLDALLARLDKIPTAKPAFLKLPPGLAAAELDAILAVAGRHRIAGFICTNLAKDRRNAGIVDPLPERGGISGKPLAAFADETIRQVYGRTKGQYTIIGCGGIFSAEDAYRKIRLGASLVQLITGMIFEGPQLISEINRGLVRLLKRDGFKNISEAVGADNFTS